jgi:hypothetical protein
MDPLAQNAARFAADAVSTHQRQACIDNRRDPALKCANSRKQAPGVQDKALPLSVRGQA